MIEAVACPGGFGHIREFCAVSIGACGIGYAFCEFTFVKVNGKGVADDAVESLYLLGVVLIIGLVISTHPCGNRFGPSGECITLSVVGIVNRCDFGIVCLSDCSYFFLLTVLGIVEENAVGVGNPVGNCLYIVSGHL